MSNWVLATWAKALFAAFNEVYPTRPKGSDGSIGDLAHAQGVSGHNPDDTSGVQAERTDADSTPEVRAIDVTAFDQLLNVIQRILKSPAVRDCLIYIIYRGVIWRKAGNWVAEDYNGSDQHFGHAHFSGDPAYDTAQVDWTAVLRLGGNTVALTSDERRVIDNVERMMTQLAHGDRLYGVGQANEKVYTDNRLYQAATAPVEALPVDLDELSTLVASKLSGSLAVAVVDELQRRMQN